MAKKDYYQILGVKRTDSADTIKKNYKKLALKFHPDKTNDDKKQEYEESFKEINEAYSTLGDKTKRKHYDLSGGTNNSFSQNRNFGGGNFSDMIFDLLRSGSFGSQFSEEESPQTGKDLSYKLTITFHEAVFGCEKELLIKKHIFCKSCDGSGSDDDTFDNCARCNGHGLLKINQRTPFGVMSQTIRCDNCGGEGKIIKNKCNNCKGNGIISSKEPVRIKIPAGIDNGQTIRVRNGGEAIRNGSEGDLFLLIKVQPDKTFIRKGFDIYMELPITFSQAALGEKILIPTLSNEKLKIFIKKGIDSESTLRLAGKGIPLINNPQQRGDQYIKIIVKTPKKLSKTQNKLYEELKKLDK